MKTLLLLFIATSFLVAQDAIPLGQEFQVNTGTHDFQSESDVCGLRDGGFVICWASSGRSICAQRYSSEGQAVGGNFRVDGAKSTRRSELCICGLSNGGFVIYWTAWDQDGHGTGIC